MMHKELFEKYFKYDFLALVSDRVPNVRMVVAKIIRYHFLKEVGGEFVFDKEVNEAINMLK